VLVLLPPSEGKAPTPRRGRPVDLPALSWPELSSARSQVLTALASASLRPDALQLLGVGASLEEEVRRNADLADAPAIPVPRLYTGVLYNALDLPGLPPGAKRRAARRIVVVSALWGLLRPADRVPAYRLSMATDLPGIGGLPAFWRSRLDAPLVAAADDGLIVDCRSSTYQAPWQPRGDLAARTVAVRVLHESGGRRTVVSHMAKHTRGEVTRHLMTRTGADPRTPRALASAVAERFPVELIAPTRPGRTWTLDVVLRDGVGES
jgi:cytoplasmic iron level regulating protein YaaA (DUF328/UPF0246 family)